MNLKELWDSLTPNQQKRFRIYFKKVKTKKVKTKKTKFIYKSSDKSDKYTASEYNRKKKYGLTREDVNRIFKNQQELCDVCGKKLKQEEIRIDHDHKSKKIRGILCHSCNVGLGFFKDSIILLENAKKYLKKNL